MLARGPLRHVLPLLLAAATAAGACGDDSPDGPTERAATVDTAAAPTTSVTTAPGEPPEPPPTTDARLPAAETTPRPDWLGTRVLPVGPDGFGEVQPTPPELADRRFATIDVLPPPTTDDFAPVVEPVPADVVTRSTWTDECPVSVDDLRHITMPHWGFDGLLHTGELLVHRDAVDTALAGFGRLFDRRFPIEAMRIATVADLDAPPTGDGNTSGAFVCRPTRGSSNWSQHAYGLAIDINPFHNPYVKGDLVLPELASTYADRSVLRPGMLTPDDVAGFRESGWGWGGTWRSLKDHMHVSANGR